MKKVLLSLVLGSSMVGFSQLYEQTANLDINGIVSNYYTDLDTVVSSSDDFIVPANDIWDLTSVTVHGFRNGSGVTMDSVKVEIFNDNAASPGSSLFSDIFMVTIPAPQSDTALTFTFPAVNLTEGTYWLSVTGYAPGASRWNWSSVTSAHGAVAMLIDVDDYFSAGATNWTVMSGLGLAFTDLAFSVDGNKYAVGVEENMSEKLVIFPNPVVNQLNLKNIDLTTVNSIKIYNTNGQVVENMPIESQLNLSQLAVGTYLVEVVTEKGIMRKSFIKR